MIRGQVWAKSCLPVRRYISMLGRRPWSDQIRHQSSETITASQTHDPQQETQTPREPAWDRRKVSSAIHSRVGHDLSGQKDYNLQLNIQLASIPNAQTVSFILDHIDEQLDHDLLENFIRHNLSLANFESMVSLVQVLIEKQDFVPSNQLWNQLIEFTCCSFSLRGAQLVLHNVIDRYQFYDEKYSAYNGTQDFFPFLVTPKILEKLCGIFQKNGMPDEIILIRDYLKRFYSLYGERRVFKTISMSLVEAYSQAGDVKKAMSAFRYLCMMFEGHRNPMKRQEFLEQVHSTFHSSYSWRVKNIASNAYRYPEWPEETKNDFDKLQDLDMLENDRALYWPIDAKSSSTRVQPFIEHSVVSTDLPVFSHLINNVVTNHVKGQGSSKVTQLLKMVKGNHFKLITFVVHSLTSNGRFSEASLFLSKIRYEYLDLRLHVLFPDDMFIQIFQDCLRHMTQLIAAGLYNVEELLELDAFSNDMLKRYLNVNKKQSHKRISSKIMSAYLSLSLNSPRFQRSLVHSNLQAYAANKAANDKIYLSEEDYNTFNRLYGLDNSVFSEIILPRSI